MAVLLFKSWNRNCPRAHVWIQNSLYGPFHRKRGVCAESPTASR